MLKTKLLNHFLNKKVRLLIYATVFLGIAFYFVCYVDSIRFFNLKKTILSLSENVELGDFEEAVNTISHDNMLNAKLDLINGQPYLVMEGFDKELLIKQNSRILKRNVLHPSYCLSLFSMGYASDYLIDHYRSRTLNKTETEILEDVYLFVYKEIINPLSLNTITLGDHVISERIQFISLFSTYIRQYYPEKKKLLNALSKDFNICLGFLLDKKSFTWQTNHGIMQLRSLAQVAGIIKDEKFQKSILDVFDRRLTDIIPYHIGPDGAIYEAASGYWIYILNQFTKITEIEAIANLKSIAILKDELQKSRLFISTVAANNGFLQGLGDSYSTHIFDTLENVLVPQNRYFLFSNELAGANWSVENMNFNVLFVSLNTPPNIHKLPEDLAVYLYANHPVFSNTGTFSFDASKVRLFFKSEKSQSTVGIINQSYDEPISSELTFKNFQPDDNRLTVIGEKHYYSGKSVTRLLDIDPKQKINIKDYTSNNDTLIAYYNVHPEINIKIVDDKHILLQAADSANISLFSNCDIKIIEGIISQNKEKITPIQRLVMIGNPIETTIFFPEIKLTQAVKVINSVTEKSNRYTYSKYLESKYKNPKYVENAKKLVLHRSILGLSALILFVFVFELFAFTVSRNL